MRCGVFLCECGGNISGVLDLGSLADATRGRDGVVSVAVNQFMCGTEGRRMIEEAVEERGLDRIVIGACSRRFQGPTFERIARELRLGENAVAFANLREGCSFVHRNEPAKAQSKAEKIVSAAVARARFQSDLPRGRTFLHRSALVVGGGIAGITAAEELAGAGIDVHLVEREQTIGGYMARLNKTFPTEDCAMCSLAPQLTGAALEPRTHIHTLTDVTEISGPPGEFRVKLRHRPRFVSEACVGCDDCTPVCPVSVSSEFELGIAKRKAISRPFTNAVPSLYAIEKRGSSPCKSACPAGTAAQGYVALIAAGRFDEAYRVASGPNPFPSVCGRICTHPCESACARGDVDEPVAIAALKRFVADRVGPETAVEQAPVIHSEKVAIVGAGPAGLTCARDLAKLGYQTTVFEALPVAGGMLKTGIPDYRLPKDVLGREIDAITALGVKLETGKRAGKDFTVDGLLSGGYGAAFLAVGLQRSSEVEIAGAELEGTLRAVEFLRELNLGEKVTVGDRVVVIGGGDVALDAARSAIRLQKSSGREPDVTLAYRRTREEMPALDEEIEQAIEEGLKLEFLVAPIEIVGETGRVSALKLQRCELGEPDSSGRRRPVPIDGDFSELEADNVVFAIGQDIVCDFLDGCEGVKLENGQIRIDPGTLMTEKTGVFAGGDAAATGGWTAIEAVAAGSRAARSIHNFLRGETLLEVWPEKSAEARPSAEELAQQVVGQRIPVPLRGGAERRSSWDEVVGAYSEEQAIAEASRCLNCAVCSECESCVRACPAGAIELDQQETIEELAVGAIIITTGHQEFDARRKRPLGFGRFDNVITQSQLARLLSPSGPTAGELNRPSDGAVPKKIFMLQCVGSRDCSSSGNEHCSAICCLFATLHASLIKQHDPDADVTIGYTDLRAPGKAHEEYYRLVQERGVRYVRSRSGEILEEPDKRLLVRFEDTVTGRKNEELFDLVVLSAGLEASNGTTEIARVAGLQQGSAGFIKEYHPKLRPVDTQRAGIFVAGTAQGPKSIPDTIAQAKAAASRVVSMLSSGYVLTPAQVASSDVKQCIGCGICAEICPQSAVALTAGDSPHAVVDANSCRGCGICAAECPTGAMTLGGFSDEEIVAEAMA
ncbi:MAG: FAD-dependent oxidoreductase [Gaiellaceae bacterium]